ncbi:hypothetical protein ABZ815_37465 [Nonomuraea sp. NPDC047529]|uniref:hypothetical protein n=1 Tax=Nonomuraea sp. NPDC047529 TaxID=3155623 RepID=UPI00340A2F1B
MSAKRRSITILFAALATGAALVATSPSALAQGNCYHFGYAGYAQLFTGYNFDGDCFEVQVGTGWHTLPAYASRKISSVRSWGWNGSEQVQLADSVYNGGLNIPAGSWVTNLDYMDDKTDHVKFD